jgi:WD40 repeat protein
LSWSPDGKSFLIGCVPALWIVDARGGGLRRLGVHGVPYEWSPDGASVLYVSGNGELVRVVDTRGGAPRTLAVVPAGVDDVSWPRDGIRLAVASNGSGMDILDTSTHGDRRLRLAPCRHLGGCQSVAWQPVGGR